MAKYSASGSQTVTTSAATALTVGSNATTAQRNRVSEVSIGHSNVSNAPVDVQLLHTVQRCTALGTATGVTPTLLDPADRAAQAAAGEDHTVEPTYTASQELLEIWVNTRGFFRWVAVPGYELITPATVGSGVGAKTIHASSAPDWRVGMIWEE